MFKQFVTEQTDVTRASQHRIQSTGSFIAESQQSPVAPAKHQNGGTRKKTRKRSAATLCVAHIVALQSVAD